MGLIGQDHGKGKTFAQQKEDKVNKSCVWVSSS
ncbi:hypothetical protein HKBW3S03_01244 [Candidatus Hakubella thermalkaliphila]|uniref:Uncharacterized protein n=1 Tax=Candidatus Hakubella thermalkaliphila TaxID=2754717 RepID=A0A6V8PJ27_9ACTN|nr:hypothetical protein HKBW3S03_01244 [Candidatus Hakubella thermalkaliphila]GFP30956.1 hypothetical protein HKBW3S34_01875 [Candidatus Hakubella thermalkaliphila]